MAITKETAATLRAQYKALGWSGREISVKISLYAGGSSISVRVESARVDIEKARDLAESCEEIRRDHFGEILSGGNLYVHFNVSQSVRAELGAPYLAAVEAAAAQVSAPEWERDHLAPIIPGALLGREPNGYGFELRFTDCHDSRPRWIPNDATGRDEAAYLVASHRAA